MRKMITLYLSVFLITLGVQAQPEARPVAAAHFQQMLDNVRQHSGVQGIAVSIIESGKAPLRLTSGFADIAQRTPAPAW